MSSQTQYGIEMEDDETHDNIMRNVVNVTDEVVTFRIASVPGSKPFRYRLAPYGKAGSSIALPEGYVLPYKGAGRDVLNPIIERITSRHVGGHEGAKLPMVVDEDKKADARAAWLRAHKDHHESKRRKPVMVALEVDPEQLVARSARISTPAATAEPASLVGEEVGQDDRIEPPHPDDDPIVVADGPPPDEQGPAPESDAIEQPRSRRGRA